MPMPAPVVGQIVRPKWQYIDAQGTLRDWQGLVSAQAIVLSVHSSALIGGAPYFDPQTSAMIVPTKTEAYYTLQVFDIEAQLFAPPADYPESELELAQADGANIEIEYGVPLLVPIPFDPSDPKVANLFNIVRMRA